MGRPEAAAQTVGRVIAETGIRCALGGSGLLAALGLVDEVRDWDFTTDAPPDAARARLLAPTWRPVAHGDGSYASAYRFQLAGEPIEVIGRFAIRTGRGVCRLPTVAVGAWHGMPLGSPEVWLVAYRLMGRNAKADLLHQHLGRNGADRATLASLGRQPLPDAVLAELAALAVDAPPTGRIDPDG